MSTSQGEQAGQSIVTITYYLPRRLRLEPAKPMFPMCVRCAERRELVARGKRAGAIQQHDGVRDDAARIISVSTRDTGQAQQGHECAAARGRPEGCLYTAFRKDGRRCQCGDGCRVSKCLDPRTTQMEIFDV
jgi:hypothetical protein